MQRLAELQCRLSREGDDQQKGGGNGIFFFFSLEVAVVLGSELQICLVKPYIFLEKSE